MIKSENAIKNCLHKANKGQGHVSPNPLVGAVVFDKDGNFVSSGYHEKYGEAHAEVNAIKKAGDKTNGGTIAVNLEPCSHWGKTPPCVDLIIKSGFKKVIIGMSDPNPKVNGRGIQKLVEAGIDVETDVLKDECEKLNEIFIKNQKFQKTFVAIKTATTLDGKIATFSGDSKWITGEKSRAYVQQLRNKYDAILTSSSTVLTDNPQMTCRKKGGRNPIRIVLDRTLKTSFDLNFYENNCSKVIVVVDEKINDLPLAPINVEFLKCPSKNKKLDLSFALEKFFAMGIMSILVEAGGTLNGAFVKAGLVDKIYQFIAPKIVGDKNAKNWMDGLQTQKMEESKILNIAKIKHFDDDIMLEEYFIKFEYLK